MEYESFAVHKARTFRSPSSRGIIACFLVLWSAQLLPLAVSRTGAADAGGAAISPSDATSFSVPYSESRPLDLVYETDLPAEVRAFRELHGDAWLLYWDDLAQTPRYLVPREPFALIAGGTLRPEEGYAGVEAAVRDFVAASGGLFGVSDAELEPAVLHPIAEDLLLVFGQRTRDGFRVRGASLRVYVSTDGRLVSAKAYLLRGASERWESLGIDPAQLLDRDTVTQKASEAGTEVLDARLELVFPIGSASEVRPAWRLRLVGIDHAVFERVVDAANGATLGSYPIVKYGTRQGSVVVNAPPLDDPFAHPEDSTELQGLGGAVVTDSSGTPRAVSNASGTFRGPISLALPLAAALAHAPAVAGCQGAFNACLDERPPCYDLVVRPDRGEARLCDPRAPRCLADALDFVSDCIPDSGDPFLGSDDFLRFGESLSLQERIDLNWWLLVFAQSVRILDSVREAIESQQLGVGPFSLLTIRPVAGGGNEIAVDSNWSLLAGGSAAIRTSPSVAAPGGGLVPRMATQVGHEVGHHLFHNLTGIETSSDVEEAIADAWTAFANVESRIGYQRVNQPGPFGFELGQTTGLPPGVTLFRSRVGGALLEFFQFDVFNEGGIRVREILLRWILTNRVADPQDLAFQNGLCILDELLTTSRQLSALRGEDPDNQTRMAIEGSLRTAFRHSAFHQGVIFLRGDPNFDGEVDISDPVAVLQYLFLVEVAGGAFHDCKDAMEANDDGRVDISDAVYLLRFLFVGDPAPPAPFPSCGQDMTWNDEVCCLETPRCAG
jgi:hypothetical protein